MSKDIKPYLRYYYGQECIITAPDGIKYSIPDRINEYWIDRVSCQGGAIQPILRKLESMKEEEMTGLLLSMIPPDMEDAPDADDYDLDMFYNDGGNMVDGDVAAGANYSCRCYEGQIAIRQNGDVELFDEEGERERFINQAAAFHYLLSRSFDLFGLIDAGLAVDKDTIA